MSADNLSRLRWRARRGLLENDLLLTRFLDKHGSDLNAVQVSALTAMLELPDNDLLDLMLERAPVEPDDSTQRDLLRLLRTS